MRYLTIQRHAKSSWDGDEDDFNRPLNHRGAKDAPAMAQWAVDHLPPPDVVLSSSAVRARTTAAEVVEAFGLAEDRFMTDEQLYLASPRTLRTAWEAVADTYAHVWLVAHNPGMTWFFNELSSRPMDNFVTGAVAHFAWDGDSVGAGLGELIAVQVPRELG